MRDLLASVRELVALLTARFDFHALYPATVVSQAADGTIDVKIDSTLVARRLAGTTGLRIRNGIPGLKIVVPKGARVRVGFEGGDPAQPYAALWDSGALPGVQIYLAADAWAVRGGPSGALSWVGVDENGAASLSTAMGSHVAVDPRTGVIELLCCDPSDTVDGAAQWAATVQLGPSGFSGTFKNGNAGFKWDAETGEFTSTGIGHCTLGHSSGTLGSTATSLTGVAYGASSPSVPSTSWGVSP